MNAGQDDMFYGAGCELADVSRQVATNSELHAALDQVTHG